ncbi:hypothetical protein [Pectobacterium phage vB_ParM-25]|nr:hypothetical protein [Pectobacterium phage vB_ParM-25]
MFSPMFEMIGNFLNGCPRSFITTDGSVTLEEMKGWFGNGYNIVVFTPRKILPNHVLTSLRCLSRTPLN